MNVCTERKQTHRHREQNYGHRDRRDGEMYGESNGNFPYHMYNR